MCIEFPWSLFAFATSTPLRTQDAFTREGFPAVLLQTVPLLGLKEGLSEMGKATEQKKHEKRVPGAPGIVQIQTQPHRIWLALAKNVLELHHLA